MIASWKKIYDKPRPWVEKQRYYFADKGLYSQGYGLLSCHIWFWELDPKEGWELKNWCLQTVALEKTPESPLDSKPANLKGNQPWILIKYWGWSSTSSWSSSILQYCWLKQLMFDANSWLVGKVPCAGKNWGQKEKWASEDEMAGWHQQCSGRELGQLLETREAWHAAVHGVTKS